MAASISPLDSGAGKNFKKWYSVGDFSIHKTVLFSFRGIKNRKTLLVGFNLGCILGTGIYTT